MGAQKEKGCANKKVEKCQGRNLAKEAPRANLPPQKCLQRQGQKKAESRYKKKKKKKKKKNKKKKKKKRVGARASRSADNIIFLNRRARIRVNIRYRSKGGESQVGD